MAAVGSQGYPAGRSDDSIITLDPYQCIAKKNRKYASECTEVYLSKQGATSVSENFAHFGSLEVIWFNGNKLSRLENLEGNFRIREVYIQDNRMVSLHGLRSFKFLRVLLASNNQLRNLDKQLAVLTRFAFLKKLDLFGNPVAEEPDYRLRVIYSVPQVEILDQHSVKVLERQTAEEVVPNLDKVSAAKVEKAKRRTNDHSVLEKSCFHMARDVRQQRQRREDEALEALGQTFTKSDGGFQLMRAAPEPRAVRESREAIADPRARVMRELTRPTPWEKVEMRPMIERKAGKAALTRQDVQELAEVLAKDGVEEVGRVLGDGMIFRAPSTPGRTKSPSRKARLKTAPADESEMSQHPLAKLLEDSAATMTVSEVTNYLLTLDWPRPTDEVLDRRIAKLYEDARRADFEDDAKALAACRNTVMRLEGIKTQKHDVALSSKDSDSTLRKARADVYSQSFLRARRQIDDSTGRMAIKVASEGKFTHLGG